MSSWPSTEEGKSRSGVPFSVKGTEEVLRPGGAVRRPVEREDREGPSGRVKQEKE